MHNRKNVKQGQEQAKVKPKRVVIPAGVGSKVDCQPADGGVQSW